jgi:hypothetical protein
MIKDEVLNKRHFIYVLKDSIKLNLNYNTIRQYERTEYGSMITPNNKTGNVRIN